MALSLKHAFASAKADGTDVTKVQPSNWNAEHAITLAADKLIGRDSSGAGAAQEIACTAFGRSIISAADLAALVAAGVPVATTGDVKFSFKPTADAGWILATYATIGDATSGAGARANADCLDLFTLIYTYFSDANCPLYTQNGGALTTRAIQGTPTNAFNNHCVLFLPNITGRVIGAAGSGNGLTVRALGSYVGAETHALSVAELASHNHNITDPGHTHGVTHNAVYGASFFSGAGGGGVTTLGAATITISTGYTGITINNNGSGTAHNNMQPTVFLNAFIKL